MSRKTFTLTAATLLVLNTMIGGGLFINPKQLALTAGVFSPLGYVIAACLMLPLILSIAELARLQPVSGGLYVYSKIYLNPFAGFLSGWAYFLSKSTSAAFLLHTVNTFFANRFAILQGVPPLFLDMGLISLWTIVHLFGIPLGGRVQYFFSAMKFTPLLFGFFAGFATFESVNLQTMSGDFSLSTLGTIIPICLYALVGFELICSVGGFIENPATNIRRAILTAFAFVSGAVIFFQLILCGALGNALGLSPEPILALGIKFLGQHAILAKIMNGLVFASISGGAFFMLGGNCWNLHTLAKDNHLPFSNHFAKLNRYGAPWVALVLQAMTSITMVSITSQQLPLQNMVVFSLFSCFLMTCFAAFNAGKQRDLRVPIFVPILAIGTCSYVIGLCLSNIIKYGVSSSFLSFFLVGLTATFVKRLYNRGR